MSSFPDLDDFLVDLGGRRRRLLSLAPPGSAADLVEELTDLGEQLLVADEELRVQQETLEETRRALERLAHQRDELWDRSATPHVATDLRGVVRDVNRAADDLVGRPAGRTTPRPIATWFAVEDRAAIRSVVTALTHGRAVDPVLATVRGAHDAATVVEVCARVDVDETGDEVLHWEFHPTRRGLVAVPDGPATDASVVVTLAGVAAGLASCREPDEVVAHLVARARDVVPEAESVGVTARGRDALHTHAGSDPCVAALDLLQAGLGEGPAWECAESGEVVLVSDVAVEPRWPAFAVEAVAQGIGSMVVAPMSRHGRTSVVLTLAAREPDALGPAEVDRVTALAVHAGLALSGVTTEANLRNAVETRQQIGEAVGVLVERHKVTADAAFQLLVQASQRGNVKLREVARDVLETGQEPGQVVGR